MAKTQSKQMPGHMRPFWPIFSVVVAAAIACGIVLYYAGDTSRQAQINSIFFMHRQLATPKPPMYKAPSK